MGLFPADEVTAAYIAKRPLADRKDALYFEVFARLVERLLRLLQFEFIRMSWRLGISMLGHTEPSIVTTGVEPQSFNDFSGNN